MSALEVVFKVPDLIEAGLHSGVLERVGGIIREKQSKQIVMWLRDAGTQVDPEHPLNRLLAQSGIVHMTSSLTAPLPLIGLAITMMTFERTLSALSRLETQVQQLEAQIRQEFQRNRDLEFRAALERARDGFSGKDKAFRQNSADSAITALFKAREEYLAELETLLANDEGVDSTILSQLYLRSLHAETAYLKCLLLLGEEDLAKKRLGEILPRLQHLACLVVRAWLGREPALYFHRQVSRVNLERFFAIQSWLRDPDDELLLEPNRVFMDTLDEMRPDFWNADLIQPHYDDVMRRVLNRSSLTLEQKLQRYEQRLSEAEIIVESYQRILGFALELRTLRLSLPEWENLIDKGQLEVYGGAFIVDQDLLTQFSLHSS